jgi:hypothetical protein
MAEVKIPYYTVNLIAPQAAEPLASLSLTTVLASRAPISAPTPNK